jgi:hypothetical protein
MESMAITTQVGCKNACSYCPQDKVASLYPKDAVRRMSFDIFKECIAKIPDRVYIHFSGMSEPWLNPECTRMLLHAHHKGHRIRVFTTLAGMRMEDISQFGSVPFRSFRVHLPSVESRMNIKIDGNYIDLVKGLASSRMDNLIFNAHGEVLASIRTILEKEKRPIVMLPLSTRAGNVQLEKVPVPIRKGRVMGCARGLEQNVLLPNGNVLLCCMDWGMRHVLGNLLTGDYAGLFTGEEFLKVKKGMQCPSADILCKYCDAFTYEAVLTDKLWTIISKNFQRLPLLYRMWKR